MTDRSVEGQSALMTTALTPHLADAVHAELEDWGALEEATGGPFEPPAGE